MWCIFRVTQICRCSQETSELLDSCLCYRMEVIGGGGGGDCAYLDNTGRAVASGCHTKLPWICSKPATCTTRSVTDTQAEESEGAGEKIQPIQENNDAVTEDSIDVRQMLKSSLL